MLVPFAASWRPAAVAWGIVACYLLVAVELTSLLRRRLPRRVWHAIHLGSFGLFAFATVHLLTAGTDADRPVVRGSLVSAIGAVVLLTAYRLLRSTMARPTGGNRRPRAISAP